MSVSQGVLFNSPSKHLSTQVQSAASCQIVNLNDTVLQSDVGIKARAHDIRGPQYCIIFTTLIDSFYFSRWDI